MKSKNIFIIIACLIVLVFAFDTFFVVNQTEQAVVFQFGKPKRVVKDAGLKIKVPFLENVIHFDNRLQEINTEDKEVIASDQKRLIINAFVKYKIVDPILYYTRVRDEYGFENKFSTILDSSLRQVIGEVPLNSLLSEKRVDVMEKIQDVVDTKLNNSVWKLWMLELLEVIYHKQIVMQFTKGCKQTEKEKPERLGQKAKKWHKK